MLAECVRVRACLPLKMEVTPLYPPAHSTQDLMVNNLLPDRKLVPWGLMDVSSLPAEGKKGLRDAVLAVRYFEDQLRQRYAALVGRLEKGAFDTVENFKRVCIVAMSVRGCACVCVRSCSAW